MRKREKLYTDQAIIYSSSDDCKAGICSCYNHVKEKRTKGGE